MRTQQGMLTLDAIRAAAPSVFAARPFSAVSKKYAFVPTIAVVEELQRRDWLPVAVQQSRVAKAEKHGFQKHELRFQHRSLIESGISAPVVQGARFGMASGTQPQDTWRPELVMVNSHDRSSSFSFMAGIYRLVCENGLVCFDDSLGRVGARHVGADTGAKDIIEAAFEVIEDLPQIEHRVEQYKAINLNPVEQQQFAADALALRWSNDSLGLSYHHSNAPIQAADLLQARWWIDRQPVEGDSRVHPTLGCTARPNLWTTLNVVQENLMKGGVRGHVGLGYKRKRYTTTAVNSVGESVSLNGGLWKLAHSVMDSRQKLVA